MKRFSGSEQWKCMFPEYYADLITTRTFLIQSLYDSSELWDTLKLDCCPGTCSGYKKCPAGGVEMKMFDAIREQHIQAWAPLVNKTGNGIWTPACIDHTLTWGHWMDHAWEVPAGSGNTAAVAVQSWLTESSTGAPHWNYQDKVAWPNNAPCQSSD
jgi:hypothetical protein